MTRQISTRRQSLDRLNIQIERSTISSNSINSATDGGDDFTPPQGSPSLHTGLSADSGLVDVDLTEGGAVKVEPARMPVAEEAEGKRSSETNAVN